MPIDPKERNLLRDLAHAGVTLEVGLFLGHARGVLRRGGLFVRYEDVRSIKRLESEGFLTFDYRLTAKARAALA